MLTLGLALPAILSLLLWLRLWREGLVATFWKMLLLAAIAGAAVLQHLAGELLLGLLPQIAIAIGLLIWTRWRAVRLG